MARFDLHPDLLQHLIGSQLNHPMLAFDYAHPAFFPRLNRIWEHCQREDRRIDLNNWESDIRIELVKTVFESSPRNTIEYYAEFGRLWTHQELITNSSDVFCMGFNAAHDKRTFMMTDDERESLSNLPDKFDVYRGHHELLLEGCSWTLDYEFATHWANGLPQNNRLTHGVAKKSDVLAYFNRRNESEVMISTKMVQIVETTVVQ